MNIIEDNIENWAFNRFQDYFIELSKDKEGKKERKEVKIEYSKEERQEVKFISKKYEISEHDVCTLFRFVKTEVQNINHVDLSNNEILQIQKFLENDKKIKGVSFIGTNGKQAFKIENNELIEKLMDFTKNLLEKRIRFSDLNGDKDYKKLIAKTLYNRLTGKHDLKDYDAKIIIGLIFAHNKICLVNEPILTRTQFKESKEHQTDNYLNYLERKVRSFIKAT